MVDVGCGEGTHAFRLATHFGFRVLGIDPVQRHLDLAREARRSEVPDIASRVSFERGTATRIPAPDSSVDLVWCRDVIVHVEDPEEAMLEFARVLRPGAYAVSYSMVATDLLAPEEADQLFDVMGVVPSSADPRSRRRDRCLGARGRRDRSTSPASGASGAGAGRPGGARCSTWPGCCASRSATAPSSATRRTT